MLVRLLGATAFVLAMAGAASAQEKKPVVPHPTTVTFFVSNIECESCCDEITKSIKKLPTVTKVEGLTEKSGWVNVSFDSHAVSFHQVAQAIYGTEPQHDKKYQASIKIAVPEYAQGDNAAKVDQLFKKLEDRVKISMVNKEKGQFTVVFLPLKVDKVKMGPQGFNGGQLGHPIHDEAPKGLGLKFSIAKEPEAKK